MCETAVRILEEACNRTECLEFVVKCRPALDHLGEIGAPLLLRFVFVCIDERAMLMELQLPVHVSGLSIPERPGLYLARDG